MGTGKSKRATGKKRAVSKRPLRMADRAWLEVERKRQGYTLADVALACGLSITAYHRVEIGLSMPNVASGVLMAEFLGLDVHNFVNEAQLE